MYEKSEAILEEHGCLALAPVDMGLGKSKTIIDIFSREYTKGKINSVLIIAPNNVYKNVWVDDQLQKHCSVDYSAAFYPARRKAEENSFNNMLHTTSEKLLIMTVNYDTFSTKDKWKPIVEFVRKNKTMIVLDESHKIKGSNSDRTKRILREFCDCTFHYRVLQKAVPFSVYRVIMSGTPIGNSPIDLWSQYEFLRPNYFGLSLSAFSHRYGVFFKRILYVANREIKIDSVINEHVWERIHAIADYNTAYRGYGVSEADYNYIRNQKREDVYSGTRFTGSYRHIDELKKLIEPVSFNYAKEDCFDLPEKIKIVRKLDMSAKMKKFYADLKDNMLAQIEDKILPVTTKIALLTRLRQATSGFVPMKSLDENENVQVTMEVIDTNNVKINALIDCLEECTFPVIVVTQFTQEAKEIYAELRKYFPEKEIGINTGTVKEATNAEEDKTILEIFMEHKLDILIANQTTICEGGNYQFCSYMIFYSNGFSSIQRRQIEDRIHRIGITGAPTYIDLLYKDTVDEKVWQCLKNKEEISDSICNKDIKEFM
jgi:SNF2 family DNA or RNA helicase